MSAQLAFIPYPSVAEHGLISDQHSAALVASDGTIDWMCIPDFDGEALFGALIDASQGGHFRFGPAHPRTGVQSYDDHLLVTRWSDAAAELVLTDILARSRDRARDPAGPCIVRRLQCIRGSAECAHSCEPRSNFGAQPSSNSLRRWSSQNVGDRFALRAGDEAWTVLEFGKRTEPWSNQRAFAELCRTREFWRESLHVLRYDGPYASEIRRSAYVLHMLSYAKNGAVVAAATTSLPERLGGSRNYDYRFSWVRDVSLALGAFARLGDNVSATRFFDWLTQLEPEHGKPLQVCYGLRGERHLDQQSRPNLYGYRGSRPVLFGNRAYQQTQIGSLGYLADSAWSHVQADGTWKPSYDELIAHCADYTCIHWNDDDSGIWELQHHAPFTMSKVMCWVTLERAVRIGERTGGMPQRDRERWARTAEQIRAEVLTRGWSERANSFRQRYGAETVDADLLLMPIVGFLPADDARVHATIERICDRLTIDGFVYRFVPKQTPGEPDQPVGEFEAAFLPCLFWLATAYALANRTAEAETTLKRALGVTKPTGLFAEEYDPRTGEQLGNFPQLFTHAECVRAILELDAAKRRCAA